MKFLMVLSILSLLSFSLSCNQQESDKGTSTTEREEYEQDDLRSGDGVDQSDISGTNEVDL